MADQASLRNRRLGDLFDDRNFRSSPQLTSRHISEKTLGNYVQAHKYNELKSTKRNYNVFSSQFTHPHSHRVFQTPTYSDCMWYGSTGSPTTYSDTLAECINDFELRLRDNITTIVKNEFNVTEDSSEISERDLDKVIDQILNLIRVSYSGQININQLIDPYYPKSERDLLSYHGPWTSVIQDGPFKTHFENNQPYSTRLYVLDLNPPGSTHETDERGGLFVLRELKDTSSTAQYEIKEDHDLKYAIRILAYNILYGKHHSYSAHSIH